MGADQPPLLAGGGASLFDVVTRMHGLRSWAVEARRAVRVPLGAVLVPVGGTLYLLGGRTGAGPVATVTAIDPKTGSIRAAGRMPTPLAGASAVQVGGKTLVVGGSTGRRAGGTSAAIYRLSG